MRILHVTTFLQGGAGRAITSLAVSQRRAGHDVRVVSDAGGEPGYASYPEYEEALRADGIDLTTVRSTFKRDPALHASAAGDLRRLAAAWSPGVVHVHAAVPSIVVRLAGICGAAESAPLVHTMHGWGTAKTRLQATQDLEALECADVVTTPSRAASAHLRQLGLQRHDVQVIPYGLNDRCSTAPPDAADVLAIQSRGARRVALCIGTFGERKNQIAVLDALAADALKDTAAVFIGDGDSSVVHKRAIVLGVARRVVILGHRPDASRYLALADALVLPSRNEGLPLSVLEALRAGVPVVASPLPEIAEALGEEFSGFLCSPDDPANFAAAIRSAFDVSDRSALRSRLQMRFAECFTESRMVDSYLSLYTDAIESASLPTI
jgi:glycosyltransferase involved in cell wall biosynthesis